MSFTYKHKININIVHSYITLYKHKNYNCLTGCIQLLKNLLKDSDDTVRHKAIETLKVMAQHSAGRSVFIKESVIPAIGKVSFYSKVCYYKVFCL